VNSMDRSDAIGDERAATPARPTWLRVALRAAGALALLLVGAVGGALWSERRALRGELAGPVGPAAGVAPSTAAPVAAPATGAPGGGADEAPLEITLPPEAVRRAGLRIATAATARPAVTLTVPGTVVSNAYRETKVAALVGGVVRQILVELGSTVRRGAPLAIVFSTELAEAQMKYLAARAMLHADHQKLVRTRRLVAIGAASRQELEEVQATHDAHESELAAARQRLLLLGLTPEQIDALGGASDVAAEVTVAAPVDGVVIARGVNPGQAVMPGQELFVVADLSTVWVIGDLHESDVGRVHVGARATVTPPTTPSRPVVGRVSYLDPRVDPATRTAKVRVEIPNPEGTLRLGMYVTLALEVSAERPVTVVPRAAVQTIGERTVVYLPVADGEGRFVERPVTLGATFGDVVEVLAGLTPGERVVTEGSFFLRAEAARLRAGG